MSRNALQIHLDFFLNSLLSLLELKPNIFHENLTYKKSTNELIKLKLQVTFFLVDEVTPDEQVDAEDRCKYVPDLQIEQAKVKGKVSGNGSWGKRSKWKRGKETQVPLA